MAEILNEIDVDTKWAQPGVCAGLGIVKSFVCHWPEYSMEAVGLGLFMFSVCVYATLLQHPASPVRHVLLHPLLRRSIMGLAVGTTLTSIVLTPWGKQSGGHFNPAITFTFYRLGKVVLWDALFYIMSQFVGATIGVAVAAYALRGTLQNEAVRYAVTAPGSLGESGAFLAELLISFSLMMAILQLLNRPSFARFTPFFVGAMYAFYISFESPISGMSMNPARTFGSAFHARYWHALWIYIVAPVLGMLMGAELFVGLYGRDAIYCAKLHHANDRRCIFRNCPRSRPAPETV